MSCRDWNCRKCGALLGVSPETGVLEFRHKSLRLHYEIIQAVAVRSRCRRCNAENEWRTEPAKDALAARRGTP